MNKKILSATLMFVSSSVFAQSVDLEELYSRYELTEYSSMELPEYNKTINFEAIIVSAEQNLEGGTLLEITGSSTPDMVLARMTSASSDEKKFSQVKVGQKISAECQLEMTMGSEYLGLGDCTLK